MTENEDADDLAIVFRSAGKPVRMSTPAKWRRAITLGDLTRSTPVEMETGGRSQGVRPAGEVPALRRLFDEISPQAEAEAAVPLPQSAQPEAEAPVPAEAVTATASPRSTPLPVPPPLAAAATPKKSGRGGCFVVLGVLLVIALVVVRSCFHRHPGRPLGETVTVYVTRPVNLRPGPSSGDAPSALLGRGTALSGVWNDAGKAWFKVTGGGRQGYVWGMDLADGARPDLAVIVGHPQVVRRSVSEYREPDAGSPRERGLAAGDSVLVAGKLASGWWEVVNKGRTASSVAGVGYAPLEAFR
jgi:hypothetical protein